jgi:hypothetical protein
MPQKPTRKKIFSVASQRSFSFAAAMNDTAQALLSRSECEEVIRKLHNTDSNDAVEIVNYHISQFSEGYPGFLGDYYRLAVEYHHHHRVSVLGCSFVRLLSCSLSLLININEAVSSLLVLLSLSREKAMIMS